MIHQMLVCNHFVKATVSVRAVQRFLKENDLKSARNPHVKDRRAFETPEFGCLWQADTAYLPYINEDGRSRRTFLIMIIDDNSRLIVDDRIFYNDNAYNYQKVLKQAISTYGLPDKLYMDHGSSFENDQLILDSLEEFNRNLDAYIRQHNTTVHSATGETPVDRFLRTKDHVRVPESQEWIDQCFLNRITRRVNNDATVTIDDIRYDVPQQFIGMRVEIRFLPDAMENAFILYSGSRFPLLKTDKNANAVAKRSNNYPVIEYQTGEASV